MTEEEVKEKIDWPVVKERMEKFLVTQRRKSGELRGIMKEWRCSPEEALGKEMWPDIEMSMGLLQNLNCLSKICSPVEARKLLADVIQERAPVGGVGRWARGSLVRPMDVLRAIQQFKTQTGERMIEAKSRKTRTGSEREPTGEGIGSGLERELVGESSGSGLPPAMGKMVPGTGGGREMSREQVMLKENSSQQKPLRPCHRREGPSAGLLGSGAKPIGR